jgi:hypothetical protein
MVSHFAFENDLQRNLPVKSVIDVATIHADEPLAGPKRHQSVGHRSSERSVIRTAPSASRVGAKRPRLFSGTFGANAVRAGARYLI